KGVVQQVVENAVVQLGLGGQVLLKQRQRRFGRPIDVAHPQGQLAHLGRRFGKQVRLQVEHDLQAVLDLPQEAVVFFQDQPLLVRQAAALLELGDGQQRVAHPQLREIAAVEQLQELDGELDVADAAVAGLDVA